MAIDRLSLLDRLRQTAREAESLRTTISQVPDELIWKRPIDTPSIAELIWLIYLADHFRFRPIVDAIIRGHRPRMEHVNANVLLGTDPAPEDDIDTILQQLVECREKLVERLEEVPEDNWITPSLIIDRTAVTCGQFAEDITHHDAEIWREIGHRLHASDLREKS